MSLSKGEGPKNEIRREGRIRNQDCATCPLTYGWIRTVLLVFLPESEWEGFKQERRLVLGEVDVLGFRA